MTLADAFWTVHAGLPRQAPGSDTATRSMLRLAGGADKFNTVLDLGCGPGRSAITLAEQGLKVTAVDHSDTLLAEAKEAAKAKNLTIDFKQADMRALPLDIGQFDLLWAEGSVYAVGFEAGLKAWRQYLLPTGVLVVTDCVWTAETPSEAAKTFWAQAYPTMMTIPEARASAERAGYDVVHLHVLSETAWWDEYYIPLQKRHDDLRDETDPAIKQAIEIGKAEIALRETHPKEYGYVGFILKRR